MSEKFDKNLINWFNRSDKFIEKNKIITGTIVVNIDKIDKINEEFKKCKEEISLDVLQKTEGKKIYIHDIKIKTDDEILIEDDSLLIVYVILLGVE